MSALAIVVVPAGRCDRHERAEESVLLVEGTRGEKQGVRRTGVEAVAKCQAPQTVDLDRPALRRTQRPAWLEPALVNVTWVEGVNATIAEITHKEIATELSEVQRSYRKTPRRVEFSPGSDAYQEIAGCVECVHIAVALAPHVIVRGGIL